MMLFASCSNLFAAQNTKALEVKEHKLKNGLTVWLNEDPVSYTHLFFFLFIGFLIIYMSLRKHLLARIIYVTLFSIYFYYKSSGFWFFLLLFTATSDFCIAQGIFHTTTQWKRKLWVVLSLCINLGMLGYFKYFNFLLDMIASVTRLFGYQFGNCLLYTSRCV